MENCFYDAVSVFPERIRLPVTKAYKFSPQIYEIRLISERSVFFYTSSGVRFITCNGEIHNLYSGNILMPFSYELDEIINRAMGYSGFLYDKELREGFITYAGACRMGICTFGGGESFGCGTVNSLVIRLPYLYESGSDSVISELLPLCKKGLLLAGAPGSGKTTLLRSISKKLSDGATGKYEKVTVIDERGEISSGADLGACTDVIKGKEKAASILHAVRLLSPQYIICDEMGNIKETNALTQGLNAGVSFIASIHASTVDELMHRRQFRILFNENVFGTVAFLSAENPGEVNEIYSAEEIRYEISRTYGNMFFHCDDRHLLYEYT